MTRRDRCYLTGKRAARLSGRRAVNAWRNLAAELEALGDADLPKFDHLLRAIRRATIESKPETN